nr:hypothetical protein [Tanacetum cinerariifolium]
TGLQLPHFGHQLCPRYQPAGPRYRRLGSSPPTGTAVRCGLCDHAGRGGAGPGPAGPCVPLVRSASN